MDLATHTQASQGYLAAIDRAAFYVIPNPGYLRFSGETREDYLQRQTSNDLRMLSATRAVPSILPSPNGRIFEVFTLIKDGDSIGMLTQSGHGPGLAVYFQKRIFFNDKVTIQDVSQDWAEVEVHGPAAGKTLHKLGVDIPVALDEVISTAWKSQDIRIIVGQGFTQELRYHLVLNAGALEQLTIEFSRRHVPQMSRATRETLRIERGIAGDAELTSEYTPFEVGLGRLVSSEKGCYTGQEVLARQVTYDKIVRNLVQLRAEEAISPGDSVLLDKTQVGKITSAGFSHRLGHLGLGVVRKPYDKAGISVNIVNPHSSTTAFVEPLG